jgi:hypothetical protein
MSHSMVEHAGNVWYNHVLQSGYSELYVVAHSAGGSCLRAI